MNRKTSTLFRYIFPLVGWACLMLVVSSMPGNSLPQGGFWQWDKLAHTFEYFVLGMLFYRYVVGVHRVKKDKAFVLVGVCIPLFGVLDELHQLLIPLRTCSWQDMVANSLGAVFAIALLQNKFIWKKVVGG